MEEKQESQENSKKDFIFMVSIALILFVVAFITTETTFTKNTIEDIEDNTGIDILENNDKNESEVNTYEEQKKEKEWIYIGMDISKIQDVYTELYEAIYNQSYPHGGFSFTSESLISFIAVHMDESDLEYIEDDSNKFPTGFLSDDKAHAILKKYFGENYRIDPNQIGEHGITGVGQNGNPRKGHRIKLYDEERKGFIVEIIPFGMEYGPSAILELRKMTGVYERDNEIKVEEKAIYTDKCIPDDDNMCYSIYADPEKTNYIGQLSVPYEELKNYTISVEDYLEQASTITSIFRQSNDGSYYFASSIITP